jgi:excisionase family DNA binding protein
MSAVSPSPSPSLSLSDLPDFLTPAEVRGVLRVRRTACYRLLRKTKGKAEIPSIKVGRLTRVRRDDLLDYIRRQSEAA